MLMGSWASCSCSHCRSASGAASSSGMPLDAFCAKEIEGFRCRASPRHRTEGPPQRDRYGSLRDTETCCKPLALHQCTVVEHAIDTGPERSTLRICSRGSLQGRLRVADYRRVRVMAAFLSRGTCPTLYLYTKIQKSAVFNDHKAHPSRSDQHLSVLLAPSAVMQAFVSAPRPAVTLRVAGARPQVGNSSSLFKLLAQPRRVATSGRSGQQECW